jgi:hypothetical protein
VTDYVLHSLAAALDTDIMVIWAAEQICRTLDNFHARV